MIFSKDQSSGNDNAAIINDLTSIYAAADYLLDENVKDTYNIYTLTNVFRRKYGIS